MSQVLPFAAGLAGGLIYWQTRRGKTTTGPGTLNQPSITYVVPADDSIRKELETGKRDLVKRLGPAVLYSINSGDGHPHAIREIELASGEISHVEVPIPHGVSVNNVPSHVLSN